MEFHPDDVDPMLAGARRHIEGAYTEKGCVHYAWTKDLLNPGRVFVFEEWAEGDDLGIHLASHWYDDMRKHLGSFRRESAEVKKFRINQDEPVYDDTGVARADFFTATEATKSEDSRMRVIVAGVMEFEPDVVDEALTSARPHIEGAYTEKGCVHYAWTKDLLNPGRVYVFEEWDEQDDLAFHLGEHWYRDMGAHLQKFGLKSADVKKYRVDKREAVYDETGVARADFFTD